MKDYLKLLKFVKPHFGLFISAAISMIFTSIFDGVSLGMIVPLADKVLTDKKIIIPGKLPAFVSSFVDKINSFPPKEMLNYMIIAGVFLFLFKGLFTFMQSYFMSSIGQRVIRDIRVDLYTKFQSLSMDYFSQKRGGELISRITNDVGMVENAVSFGSTDLIYQTMQVIIFTFIIFFVYPQMAFMIVILLVCIILPILKIGKLLKKISRKGQEKMADINSILYETMMGMKIVKAFNMEKYEIKRFVNKNTEYYKLTMKSIKRMLILSPFTEILGGLSGLFVFYWGGKEVIDGKISFGALGLFLASMLSLIRPFKKLSQVHAINQRAIAASVRIHEVLESKPTITDKKDAVELNSFTQNVVFDNVYFNYEANPVIQGVSFEVKKGEVCALVGPSGAGKTTLLDLLIRFYDPIKGRILIDGKDIKDLTMKSIRSQIGIVSQETFLFNDTIGANIRYGRSDATQEEIEAAAMKAHAHEFIIAFPEGYDTVIGDRGSKLSGGERQRIAIARALLKNSPILLLDEATSQLDSESERIVQQALNTLIQGRTVFVIAHRLSTVKNSNKILVIEKGQILEQGRHDELLSKGGLYKRLCQNQNIILSIK